MSSAAHASPASAARPLPYSEGEWISRVRASDAAAFELLVHRYADRLCAFVYNQVGDAEVAKELVQDVFLWIWRNRQQWEIAGGLTTYLYRCARNRAISHVRHQRLEMRWRAEMARSADWEHDQQAPPDADVECETSELAAAIACAIGALPERCRQVFTLNREHGLTYAQIAETLGISAKTVEVHMGRALTALRRRLADWAR